MRNGEGEEWQVGDSRSFVRSLSGREGTSRGEE